MSPSSLLISYDADYSHRIQPRQRNSDQNDGPSSLNLSPSLLICRDISSTHVPTSASKNKSKGYSRCDQNIDLSYHDKKIESNSSSNLTNNEPQIICSSSFNHRNSKGGTPMNFSLYTCSLNCRLHTKSSKSCQ